jgi:hypothetical protein
VPSFEFQWWAAPQTPTQNSTHAHREQSAEPQTTPTQTTCPLRNRAEREASSASEADDAHTAGSWAQTDFENADEANGIRRNLFKKEKNTALARRTPTDLH